MTSACPTHVRIVGFNGFEAHRYARPRLDDGRFGRLCSSASGPARAMLERLESGRFARAEHVLPVHFDAGATT